MSTLTAKIEKHLQNQITLQDCVDAFAVPGSDTLIDVIHPTTGKSLCYGETLEQIRVRYPGAEVIAVARFQVLKANRQDAPVQWLATTETEYDEMLGVLPPAFWQKGLFLVGEPWDHHAISGRPRYAAYRQLRGDYYKASRPMTVGECRTLLDNEAKA